MGSAFPKLAAVWTALMLLVPRASWAFGTHLGGTGEAEDQVYSEEGLTPYEGKTIASIRIEGLVRTRERAVRGLLGGREGEPFSADRWVAGIKKLYDTIVLYEVKTQIQEAGDGRIDITLSVHDKWTIFPFFTAQAGGGTAALGGGLYDANLGGYFTQASAGLFALNGIYGYDLNLYQEWLLDTQLMLGLDSSKTGYPVTTQDKTGNITQNFVWFRTQQQLLLGSRVRGDIRAYSFLELFNDAITSADSSTVAQVYPFTQYRLRPVLIFGRSNLTDWMEEGHELTFAPTTANFFGGSSGYHQFVVTYKWTHILNNNANVAYYLNGGIMTSAPMPYQFRLGGLDTVRGFTTNRVIGDKYLNAVLEYRPTLIVLRVPAFDVDLLVLQGCLFTDWGLMNGSSDPSGGSSAPSNSLQLWSAGVGLRGIAAKFAGAMFRLDFAQSITPAEGYDISFGVGQAF